MNPVFDAALGGWELNVHQHRQYRARRWTCPTRRRPINDVTGLTNDYRGQAIPAPQCLGTAPISQSKNGMVNNYFAGYTFTTPPANAPFGNLGRNAFRAPGLRAMGSRRRQELPHPGRHGAAVPVGVLQRSESHELRRSEHHHHQCGIRDDPHHVSAAADSVCVEAAVLASTLRTVRVAHALLRAVSPLMATQN